MIPLLPNLRYEKKFIAEKCTLAEVLARVRLHPPAFGEVYPPRTVNNVYLDSAARRDYHDHVKGTANRSKTRVRWYGEHFQAAERPMLERKLQVLPTPCHSGWCGSPNTSRAWAGRHRDTQASPERDEGRS